jgi:Nucleotide-diphospho-sugar transferase
MAAEASVVQVQGREKIGLINTFTHLNFSILVSDVDTVWMRNPLPFMAALPQADVLTSSDHLVRLLTSGICNVEQLVEHVA